MSSKVPLPARFPPTPSPSSHIRRYLSSLHDYHRDHVNEGQKKVAHERENGFEVLQDHKVSGDSSSAGNWSEVVYRQRRDEESGRQDLNQRGGGGTGETARRVHAVANVGPRDMKGKSKAEEDKEEESGSETSSAERRAQRKQRRREKKALRHPPPPTPPLQSLKRPASTRALGSEVSVGSFVLPPVKRRKGKADGMDLVRRFEASNVAVKRLTLRPGKGKSMFDRGATSAPVRPTRRASVPMEPSATLRDRKYMDAWRRKPLVTASNQRERKDRDEVLVPASPEEPASPPRESAATTLPDSGIPSKATNINKLPPPGRTNSSPWPSEIMASGKRGDRSESHHSRRHSDGVLETVPQPFESHPPLASLHIMPGHSGRERYHMQPTDREPAAQVDQVSNQLVSVALPISHATNNLPIPRSGSYGMEDLTETFGQSMELRREQSHVRYSPSVSKYRCLPVFDLSHSRSTPHIPAAVPIIRLDMANPRDAPPLEPLIVPQRTSPSVWSGPSSIRQPIHLDPIHPALRATPKPKTTNMHASPLIKLEALDSPYSVIGTSNDRYQISPSLPQDTILRHPPAPLASLDQLFTPPPRQYTAPQPLSRPVILDPTDNNPFLSHVNPFLATTHPHADDYDTQDPLALEQDPVSSPYPSVPETDLSILFDCRYDTLSSNERYNPPSESGVPDPMQTEAGYTWRNFWKDRPAAI